jgi:hypothetical protein
MRDTPHASRVPALILAGIAILNLARGAFHWLAPDSGAGSVAGMNLSYPNAPDVVFLLAVTGVSQLLWGVCYLYIAFWQRFLVSFALGTQAATSALVLVTEYWLKPPVSPVPGRFAHVTTLALSVAGLAIAVVVSRRNRRG